MDRVTEAVILAADTCLLAYFLKRYFNAKNSVKRLEAAPQLNIGDKLIEELSESGGCLPYAAIRGKVVALSPAIQSFYSPNVAGVVQKVTVREHVVSQSRTGFWIDDKRLINTVVNSVPFAIRSSDGNVEVEVVDALAAKVLDLDVVADRFDPAPSTFIQNLWQVATGVRKQGVQTMEELLKEDTLVTVVGEVVNKSDSISIGPPIYGAPFYITTMPLQALVRRMEGDISYNKWMAIGFGALTALVCGWMVYKRMEKWSKQSEERRLQETRKERRKKVRTYEELCEDKLCVVCQTNPKEIILLPCGHVCLCEDCSDRITRLCPICKQVIASRNEAFIV